MTNRLLISGALLAALAASVFAPAFRAVAKEHMDMMQMAMQAKTPADHEKLATRYDQEAAEARAKAEMHKKMAEDIRKTGGALFSKTHYDEHCDGLATPLLEDRGGVRRPGEGGARHEQGEDVAAGRDD